MLPLIAIKKTIFDVFMDLNLGEYFNVLQKQRQIFKKLKINN